MNVRYTDPPKATYKVKVTSGAKVDYLDAYTYDRATEIAQTMRRLPDCDRVQIYATGDGRMLYDSQERVVMVGEREGGARHMFADCPPPEYTDGM